MMHYTKLCFNNNIPGAELTEFLRASLAFTPSSMTVYDRPDSRGRSTKWTPQCLDKLGASGPVSELSVRNKQRDEDSFLYTELPSWFCWVAYLDQESPPAWNAIEKISQVDAFNAAYCAVEGELNDDESALFPGLWLQASWKMWFAPRTFEFLPHERLLSFQREGASCRQLEKGVVSIQLYDEPGGAKHHKSCQRAFRDWMSLDKLVADSYRLAGQRMDPQVEILTYGPFRHGGERLVVSWLDATGRPTPKSAASRKRVDELDHAGRVIWQEEHFV